SNNGYYAQRLCQEGVGTVFALDPQALYVAQAHCVEGLTPQRPVITLPVGLSLLNTTPRSFSLLLLMGILYHQRDPIAVLKTCASALARGGHVLVETIVIPGTESSAIFVPRTYAGARGF